MADEDHQAAIRAMAAYGGQKDTPEVFWFDFENEVKIQKMLREARERVAAKMAATEETPQVFFPVDRPESPHYLGATALWAEIAEGSPPPCAKRRAIQGPPSPGGTAQWRSLLSEGMAQEAAMMLPELGSLSDLTTTEVLATSTPKVNILGSNGSKKSP